VEEIKEKLRAEVEQQTKQLQIMVNSLLTENMDLKVRMGNVEKKYDEIFERATFLSTTALSNVKSGILNLAEKEKKERRKKAREN
jgi:predicted nuclease with TOPRIM domain